MTPEEWAEKVVGVAPTGDYWQVLVGDRQFSLAGSKGRAEEIAYGLRPFIASVVRSAVAEALGSGMPGLPLADAEVGKIRADVTDGRPDFADEATLFRSHLEALLAHVYHTNALFRDMADTGEAGAYRLGYEAGAKEKAEAVELLSQLEYCWLESEQGDYCHFCGEQRGRGHQGDCRLAKALGVEPPGPVPLPIQPGDFGGGAS